MNAPKLRFKEFIHPLENTSFKKVVGSNKYGPRFNAEDYHCNGNVKTIRGTDISLSGDIKYNQVPIARLDNDFIQEHLLKDGDLVMITTADCGLTGVFIKQAIDYIASAYAVKIQLNKFGYPYYFKYYFQTKILKDEINKYIRKATVSNLPLSDITKLCINLPSFPEQTKIANFLTAIDEKITQLTQKYDLLKQYKKGVMQQIFSQKLRFKDEDGREFSEWDERLLREISNITTGQSNRIDSTLTGKYTFFDRSQDIRTSDIYLFDCEAIIVAGEGQEFLPKYFIGKFDLHQRTYAIMNYKDESYGKYLFYYIHHYRSYFLSQAVGSTVKSLRLPMFKKMPIKLPCLVEQTKIANFLTAIDDKITHIQAQLDAVKKYKKGLLQQMFV